MIAMWQYIVYITFPIYTIIHRYFYPPSPADHAPPTEQIINHGQSIHNSAVEYSMDASIKRLQNIYLAKIRGETDIDTLWDTKVLALANEEVDLLPIVTKAAKDCLYRIKNDQLVNSTYYKDDINNVSIPECITMVCLCLEKIENNESDIPENQARQKRLELAKIFINCLYEIQRGYNINADNRDIGGHDQPICLPGHFKKIIEALIGIDENVNIRYANMDSFTLRFMAVLKNTIRDAIHRQTPESNKDNYINSLFDSSNEIEDERLIELYTPQLQTQVETSLYNEFKHYLRFSSPTCNSFRNVVDSWIYISFTRDDLENNNTSHVPAF